MECIQDGWYTSFENSNTFNLGNDLKEFQQKNIFCDVIIVTSDKCHFPAHACVLASASPYLMESLQEHFLSKFDMVLQTDLSSTMWQIVLDFIYTGKVSVKVDDIPGLLETATSLNIFRLVNLLEVLVQQTSNIEHPILYEEQKSSHPPYPEPVAASIVSSVMIATNAERLDAAYVDLDTERKDVKVGQCQSQTGQDITIQEEDFAHEEEQVELNTTLDDTAEHDNETNNGTLYIESEMNSGEVEAADNLMMLTSVATHEAGIVVVRFPEDNGGKPQSEMDPNNVEDQSQVVYDEVTGKDGKTVYRCKKCAAVCDDTVEHAILHAGRPYMCTEVAACRKCFRTHSHLMQHIVTMHRHHEAADCQRCGKRFRNEYLMKRHLNLVCNSNRPYKCSICGKGFKSTFNYKYHMATHSTVKTHNCSQCTKSFASLVQLQYHLRTHENGAYSCFCGKVFHCEKSYKEHFRYKHSSVQFPCTICSKICQSKGHLKCHLVTHDRPYACKTCKKGFTSETRLLNHELTGHLDKDMDLTGVRPRCKVCNRTFSYVASLKNHVAQHVSRQEFFCAHCQKSFKTLRAWSDHSRSHSDGNLQCDVCSKAFRNSQLLQLHLNTHTKSFVCGFCQQKFAKETYLQTHSQKHFTSQVVHHMCSFCGKRCHNFSELGKHQETSHKETCDKMLLDCPYCSKIFSLEINLLNHLKNIHDGKDKASFCDPCKLTFLSDDALAKHELLEHKGLKLIPCMECPRQFRNQPDADQHVRIIHNQMTSYLPPADKVKYCTVCLEHFRNVSTLNEHELTHVKESTFMNCPCCTFTAASLDCLRVHTKRCPRLRQCKVCSIKFPSILELYKHLKLHKLGAVRYACNRCTQRFGTLVDLKEHIETQHSSIQMQSNEGRSNDSPHVTNSATESTGISASKNIPISVQKEPLHQPSGGKPDKSFKLSDKQKTNVKNFFSIFSQ